jgi:hypothetical protein
MKLDRQQQRAAKHLGGGSRATGVLRQYRKSLGMAGRCQAAALNAARAALIA